MFSYISIKKESFKSLFKLSIGLSKQNLTGLYLLWQWNLRKRLLEFFEKDQLFACHFIIIIVDIILIDPLAAKSKKLSDQISHADMNCGF